MSQLVTAPLIIAKREDGSDVYVYAGSPLPDGLAKGEAKRLAEFLGDEEDASADSSDDGNGAPAGNASLEDWAEYAKSKGATDADLDGKSRNDLRDAYGN